MVGVGEAVGAAMLGEGEAAIPVGSAVSRRVGVRDGVARVVGLGVLVRDGMTCAVLVAVDVAVTVGVLLGVANASWVGRGEVGVGRCSGPQAVIAADRIRKRRGLGFMFQVVRARECTLCIYC